MKLSKETIRRMVGQQSSRGSVAISGSGGGGGVTTLAGLTDVQIGTLADGQALMYDDTAKKWINGPVITDMATKTWVTAQNNAVKEWVNNNYISIAYFGRLFQAYRGSTAVNPNDTDSVIDGIKAMFGFWTDQYISSLGQNDAGGSGGGGGEGTVTRVAFSAPTGFSVSGSPVTSSGTIALTFAEGYSLPTTAKQTTWDNKQDAINDLSTIRSNASHGQTAYGWGNHSDYNYATQQWVTDKGYITSSALTGYATQSWVQQQGYLTEHQSLDGYLPLSGGKMTGDLHMGSSAGTSPFIYFGDSSYVYIVEDVDDHLTIKGAKGVNFIVGSNYNVTINSAIIATQSWVQQQGYLTEHQSLAGYATQSWVQQQGYLTSHQSVDGTFWGQSWSNHGSVSGNMTGVGSITSNTNGTINNFSAIELLPTSGADNGGAIYFHFNGETAYSSVFISENAKGILSLQGYGTTGLVVGDSNNDYIQIGAVRLVYDSQNNAIKVVDSNNGAAGIYATGFMSALGMSKGVTEIDRMSFNSINIGSAGTLTYNNNDLYISSNTGDMYLSSDNNLYLVSSGDVMFGDDTADMTIKIYYRTRYYTLNVATAINLGILS